MVSVALVLTFTITLAVSNQDNDRDRFERSKRGASSKESGRRLAIAFQRGGGVGTEGTGRDRQLHHQHRRANRGRSQLSPSIRKSVRSRGGKPAGGVFEKI